MCRAGLTALCESDSRPALVHDRHRTNKACATRRRALPTVRTRISGSHSKRRLGSCSTAEILLLHDRLPTAHLIDSARFPHTPKPPRHRGRCSAPFSSPGTLRHATSSPPLVLQPPRSLDWCLRHPNPLPLTVDYPHLTCSSPTLARASSFRLAHSSDPPFSDICPSQIRNASPLYHDGPSSTRLPRSVAPFSPPLFHLAAASAALALPLRRFDLDASGGRPASFHAHRHAQAQRTPPISRSPIAAGFLSLQASRGSHPISLPDPSSLQLFLDSCPAPYPSTPMLRPRLHHRLPPRPTPFPLVSPCLVHRASRLRRILILPLNLVRPIAASIAHS
ncbi:hypothetical protein C8R45DRAFT_1221411 [Mycena sanguinolenta]|nr:hypothetical protein C8R45DRAFT_1221411 [Mycena sanguinolenta]